MISRKQIGNCIPLNQINLFFESRIIWRDLAAWVRSYAAGAYSGFGNEAAIEEKIKSIISEFSNILSLVFGDVAAEQYIKLMTTYIDTLKAVIYAQSKGNLDEVKQLTVQLYENADEIAAFLAKINPYWVEGEWKSLLYEIIRLTIEDSISFLNKEYLREIEVYDKILNLTSKMGDYYSKGILDYLTFSK